MNITHHDSASLNIQAFRGKEHRGLNSTQWGSISSREPTVQWFCSKVYLSMQPAVLHYFLHFSATLNIHSTVSSVKIISSLKWVYVGSHFHNISLSSPSSTWREDQQKPSLLWIFRDLLFPQGPSVECLLANSLQSGKLAGFGISWIESPQKIKPSEGRPFFSLTEGLKQKNEWMSCFFRDAGP